MNPIAAPFHDDSRPYTRWWWLDGPFSEADIRCQLTWLRDNGFGGVELAWLKPHWQEPGKGRKDHDIPEWLGPEWIALTATAKRIADELGLGCDFTFGSCWPFGGRCVSPEDGCQDLLGPEPQRMSSTWESHDGSPGEVLNHLEEGALRRYAASLAPAFQPALAGRTSALFCDSLEVHKRHLWNAALWESFERRFGYDLREHLHGDPRNIERHPGLLYDMRKHLGESIISEFYRPFTEICHELGALSRVQCHGAPVDLLSAYAVVDIPESESILYHPFFSRVPSSAAALADRPVVSCETFTCLYGFVTPRFLEPLEYWHQEQAADLKMLADAVFAHGVNHIVWHGTPFNGPGGRNEFYASVHVAPGCGFAEELPALNGYMARCSVLLKEGRPISGLGVYMPNEDQMVVPGRPPEATVGTQDAWEMREATPAPETEGFAPLWVSGPTLATAHVEDGVLCCGPMRFPGLYLDVAWLDAEALERILGFARAGLPVILAQRPRQPGFLENPSYDEHLEALRACPSVVFRLSETSLIPFLAGDDLPWFWMRERDDGWLLFFAHPRARELRYPMTYGQSACPKTIKRSLTFRAGHVSAPLKLTFRPNESLMLKIDRRGQVQGLELGYLPPAPTRKPR